MNRWAWFLQYAIACVLALVLAAILGGSQLFQGAKLGRSGLSASELVRFFGDGAALLLIWSAAARAADTLRDDDNWRSLLRYTLIPLATLVVLAVGYGVPLFVLHPFLHDTGLMVYRWIFVLAISVSALWLAVEAYQHSAVIAPAVTRVAAVLRHQGGAVRPETPASETCRHCGAETPQDATACPTCGHGLSAA